MDEMMKLFWEDFRLSFTETHHHFATKEDLAGYFKIKYTTFGPWTLGYRGPSSPQFIFDVGEKLSDYDAEFNTGFATRFYKMLGVPEHIASPLDRALISTIKRLDKKNYQVLKDTADTLLEKQEEAQPAAGQAQLGFN